MNATINFTLTLLSDAEIGSGLGNEAVNNVVARDHRDMPVIRGSHLKGLLRAQLENIGAALKWPAQLYTLCFGRAGKDTDGGISSPVHVSQCKTNTSTTRVITRTCLTDLGVVSGATLRTTEAVPAGTVFKGTISLAADSHEIEIVGLAIRLALLSLDAVGGGRNRGGGLCRVDIENEQRTPGALLKALNAAIQAGVPSQTPQRTTLPTPSAATAPPVLMRLIFQADDPICCPETPVVSNNVIRSGVGIPASAVLGAVIARLAQHNATLADETMADPRTRAWPLLPCSKEPSNTVLPIPVRVSLSHRMSKLADEQGNYEFKDSAVESYDWRSVASNAPLKGADGVLLRDDDKPVQLWRSGEIPRLISAHAVHYGERNLFTVEALAPMVFSGWITLPETAATMLDEILTNDGTVMFGKARSIRGGGRLTVQRAGFDTLSSWNLPVYVLQSPALMPDNFDNATQPAEQLLAKLVELSGWGTCANSDRMPHELKTVTQATCGVRFGWNRNYIGTCVGATQQLRARRVFLPGTVFVLHAPPADLAQLLVRGLGAHVNGDVDGRIQGFGAVMPHPGIAKVRYQRQPNFQKFTSQPDGKLACTWWLKTRDNSPSPSQIAAIAQRVKGNNAKPALEYLEQQRMRHARIWERWNTVFDDIKKELNANPMTAQRALRTWQNLAIIHREKKER